MLVGVCLFTGELPPLSQHHRHVFPVLSVSFFQVWNASNIFQKSYIT